MATLRDTSWTDVAALRATVATTLAGAPTLEEASARFARLLAETYPTVVLARVFAVLPMAELPPVETRFAEELAGRLGASARLTPQTRVLALLGTHGHVPAWCERARSAGHLAIPLVDRELVDGAPMIAKLLGDLDVDLGALGAGRTVATRRMLGGANGRFYVADAATARDDRGREVIAARDFVAAHGVHTVFGMGGAYIDGTLVIAILFTTESLGVEQVDRFPTLINHFKKATSALLRDRRIFRGRAAI